MYLRPLGIAILCTGCAQLFGLDETSTTGSISVRLQRVSVGTAVDFNPLNVGATPPSFVVRDPAEPTGVRKVDAIPAQPGRWVAAANAVDGVIFSYPEEPVPHLLSFPRLSGSDLRAYVRTYEHLNPQPAPSPSTPVMVQVNLPTPFKIGEDFVIDAIGAWAHYAVASPPPPPPPPGVGAVVLSDTSSYSAFTPLAPIRGGTLGQINAQDVVSLIRYESVAGVRTITGLLGIPAFDQTSAPLMIAGTLVPASAAQNQSFGATVSASTAVNRFANQVPQGSPPVQSWRVDAAPGYAVGLPIGELLAEGPVTQDATTINATYFSPFSPQWHPVVRHIATSQRTFNLGSGSTVLNSSLQAIAEAGPSLTLDMAAGLPMRLAINTQPVTTDGMTVRLDVTQPLYVDITADRTENTLYEVTVVEFTTVVDKIVRTPVGYVAGVDAHLPLPPDVLKRGHTYNLQVLCTAGGYTEAGAGNLQTFSLPFSQGYAEGAVFTIAP